MTQATVEYELADESLYEAFSKEQAAAILGVVKFHSRPPLRVLSAKDRREVKAEIKDELTDELATKDFVRAEMRGTENRIIRWMVSLIFLNMGVTAAVLALFLQK